MDDGGYADFTAVGAMDLPDGLMSARHALVEILRRGLNVEQVTWSSDGHGSVPLFDRSSTTPTSVGVSQVAALLEEVRTSVFTDGLSLEDVLPVVTKNPAQRFGLAGKGRIAVGCDADLLLLDARTLALRSVWARGTLVVHDGIPAKLGMFEPAGTHRNEGAT